MQSPQHRETIVVTGASGLIGTNILTRLASSSDADVIAICRHIPENPDSRFRWVACDILDVLSLEEIFQSADKVYHCAAIVSFDTKRRSEIFRTNVQGTANVVNAAIFAGVKKILHVSSVAAIGEAGANATKISEAAVWKRENASVYGQSKYLAEMEVWRGIGEGLSAVIVNPSIVLGSADWNKGSAALFKTVYEEIPWYTSGVHGFVDVKDVACAAVRLMDGTVSAERFILNGANISYKELFIRIAAGFGVRPPYKKVTPVLSEVVWRWRYLKGILTGEPSVLNKSTARTAQAVIEYSSEKLLKYLPDFQFTGIDETVSRVCGELKNRYNL